jgi:hypothetical protein
MMIFSHQTRGSIVQVLSTISTAAAETFLYKHLGVPDVGSFLPVLASAPSEALMAMLTEILANNKVLYGAAPVKHVFKSGVEELQRWALHDGWIVENGALVRVTPAAEEATGIRDKFLQDIQKSGLDADGAIKTAIEDSSKHFVAVPPDYNGATTKVRIALETVARRAAAVVARKKGSSYPDDSWGKALQFLRSCGVIELTEEEVLARVYTFISPGAHVPKGVTAEEWARLARTFGLSSAYFLLRKYEAS